MTLKISWGKREAFLSFSLSFFSGMCIVGMFDFYLSIAKIYEGKSAGNRPAKNKSHSPPPRNYGGDAKELH
jgi:hypothetical protein